MRAGAEFGHGSQIVFLLRRQTIETDTKETLVKTSQNLTFRLLYIDFLDRRYARMIPNHIRPLLKKIRIPFRHVNDFVESFGAKLDASKRGRLGNRLASILGRQRADDRECEKTLRIRFRIAG